MKPDDAKTLIADMGMLFGKASRRTSNRFGTALRGRYRNSLKVKPYDTHPFIIKSPSEAWERSISMAALCNKRMNSPFAPWGKEGLGNFS